MSTFLDRVEVATEWFYSLPLYKKYKLILEETGSCDEILSDFEILSIYERIKS